MGWLAAGTGVALGAAIVLLWAFFLTGTERFDRLAEWAFVLFALLGVPTALLVADRTAGAGLASTVVAGIGVAGIGVTGVGELLATLRLVDFRQISAAITAAFLAILTWIGGVSVIAIASASLPAELGWLGVVSILAGFVVIGLIARLPGVLRGDAAPPRTLMLGFLVPLAGLVTWLVWLGATLG
jgi:hypothetical protein